MKPTKFHILFLHRTPIEGLPPALNQANICLERGHTVTVLQEYCMKSRAGANLLPSAVKRCYVQPVELARAGFMARVARVLHFLRETRRLLREINPDVVLVSDSEAAAAVGDLPRRLGCVLVWHFHELPERDTNWGTQRWANNYVWRKTSVPHLISFPDLGRAEIFARDAGVPARSIVIVPNCPRLIPNLPKSALREQLRSRLPGNARVVLYHGAMGASHGLETAIRSIPKWPREAVLVAKGPVAEP